MSKFKDTISVITGAGSGIGEKSAIRLAKEGSKTILVGRTKEKLQRTADRINEYGAEADIFTTDVTKEEQVNELKNYVQKTYGDLHVLVNNAGGSGNGSILDLTGDEWDRIQGLNLKSVFLVSKTLGEVMISGAKKNQRDRSIVNVASLSGHKAGAKIPHYSASKAAVINFSKAAALELAPYKIRVNSISPGFVETPLTEAGLKNHKFEEAIKRNTALERVGRPEEIANVIAFIASSEATYMTGSDILVDGGWLIK